MIAIAHYIIRRPICAIPVIAALALAASLIRSCRPQPDVPVKIIRMEQSLFSIPADSAAAAIPRLQRQYGELFNLYGSRVLYIGLPEDAGYTEELAKFLADSHMNLTCKRVKEIYPDMSELEAGLSKAFSKYRKHFPKRVIPSVYTLISGFNQSMITSDTILAIALDKYLGKDEAIYAMLEIPNYQRRLMDRKYLTSDCVKAWIYTEFPCSDSIDNVLANILYEGKVMYAVRQLLPEMPDSLLFGYTSGQERWCRNNTARMWTFLVEKKMLYSTDYLTINKLTGPAPFCSLFTRESPGRAVVWLGYSIVSSYMEHNRVSLESLLQDNNYQRILAKAKFKP